MLILIKQCRLHYICASEEDIKKYFATKDIEINLTIQPIKKTGTMYSANGKGDFVGPPVKPIYGNIDRKKRTSILVPSIDTTTAPLSSSLPFEGKKFSNPVEFSMSVKFNQLVFRDETIPVHRKFDITHSEKGCWGAEKIDLNVAINSSVLGQFAKLRLSVAVVSDSEFHERLVDCKLMRDSYDVFWPDSTYFDDRPLPGSWIDMLTPIGSVSHSQRDVIFSDTVDKLRASVSNLTAAISAASNNPKSGRHRPSSAPAVRKQRFDQLKCSVGYQTVQKLDLTHTDAYHSRSKDNDVVVPSSQEASAVAELKHRIRATSIQNLSNRFSGTILDLKHKVASELRSSDEKLVISRPVIRPDGISIEPSSPMLPSGRI
jgi:hypothetical protein